MCESLKFYNLKRKDLIWKKIGENDFICERGHYTLRVEQMDKNYWWWCVYSSGNEVDSSWYDQYKTAANCERVAKLRALKALNRYREKMF